MLARILFRLGHALAAVLGWRFEGRRPPERKFVLLGAPHTSNLDFLLTLGLISEFDLPLHYMVKSSAFRGPFEPLLRSLGAVPIDRSRRASVVDRTIEAINANDDIVVGILPEGTRKRVDHWKSGFYHIARGAGVPIYLASINGPRRRVTLGPRIDATGDITEDMQPIVEFYRGVLGVHPEKTGPVRLRDQAQCEVPPS